MDKIPQKSKDLLLSLFKRKRDLAAERSEYEKNYQEKPEELLKACQDFWLTRKIAYVLTPLALLTGLLLLLRHCRRNHK